MGLSFMFQGGGPDFCRSWRDFNHRDCTLGPLQVCTSDGALTTGGEAQNQSSPGSLLHQGHQVFNETVEA